MRTRETKARYASRAGIEPISHDTTRDAKCELLYAMKLAITSARYDDTITAMNKQWERVWHLFDVEKHYYDRYANNKKRS